jgi:4-amino-4-deoxy-L-arabinose transferase-like glycosyltransferase
MRAAADRNRWLIAIPLLLVGIVYISTGNRAVIDYDEGHYSEVALQMIQRGDWVTPYDNGVRFLEKPPWMYWVTAASFWIFGISEFALRLPSSLAMIALSWVVMRMVKPIGGTPAAAIAGLALSFSAGAYLFTREALHDVWLVLFLTLSLCAFLEWHRDPDHSLRSALVFYGALAGAVMTKSLVGLAFPLGIIALFFLLSRERPRWHTLHLLPGGLLFLALTIPWHWLAAIRNHDFLYSFFLNEQVLRFLGKHDPPIVWSIPLLTFWALILVWFFPWTAFLPAAFALRRKVFDSSSLGALRRLALIWLAVILGFYTISGRLEHYAFLILPALSILAGIALSDAENSKAVKWGFRGLAAFGVLALLAGLGIAVWLFVSGDFPDRALAPRTSVIEETDFSIMAEMPGNLIRDLGKPAVVTLISLAVCFIAALGFENRRRRLAAIFCLAAGMILVCGMIQWSLVLCEDMISSKKFGLAVAKEAQPGDHLVVIGDLESANSLRFYQPLRLEVVDGVAYSLIPGMKYEDAPRIVMSLDEFKALWKASARVFALTPANRVQELNPKGSEILRVMDRTLVRNH